MCVFVIFDYSLIYNMGKERISNIYLQLDSSSKDKGTLFQSSSSRYSANTKEGIFIRKAQFENPLTAKKRSWIIRKSQEKIGTLQSKEVIINKETREIGNNSPWEDEKWANLYMLATTAVNPDS
ncbi:hypothetical protein Hanom_Chr15g01388151 [Helianthus anomalus]